MKIYTRRGDKGKTSLWGKSDVWKDNFKIAAYGNIDEVNASLGLLISEIQSHTFTAHPPEHLLRIINILKKTQNLLFSAGAELSAAGKKQKDQLSNKISEHEPAELEQEIDFFSKNLPPLKNFILPSGNRPASMAQFCRSIVRRAERSLVTLLKKEKLNKNLIIYLNRLSDFLFILGRYLNFLDKIEDEKWIN